MRTTLKIVLPLIVSVSAVSLLFAAYQVRTEKRILRNDLSRRAEILGESLQESVEPLLERAPERSLQRLVDRFGQREHLKGVAVYNAAGTALAITSSLSPIFRMRPSVATRAAQADKGAGEFLSAEQTILLNKEDAVPIHIYALPLHRDDEVVGTLALFHDTSYIDKQVSRTLRDSLLNAFVQTVLITGLALILVRWTFTGPLTRTATWLRTLRTGQPHGPPNVPQGEIFDALHQEVTHLARDLNTARAAAEEEARLRDSNASLWTAERLRVSVRNKLQEKPLTSFRIASRTCTSLMKKTSRSTSSSRPAAWSPRWNQFCWRATERGLPTAPATRTAKPSMRRTTFACRRIVRVTRCGGCGSATRKTEVITKAFQMKGSGRFATSHTRARCFALMIGCNTKKSTADLPTPFCTKWRAPSHRFFSRRIITSRCFRGWSRKRVRTREWRFSGTFRGPIRRCSAFVRGNGSLSTVCWAPISSAFIFNRTVTIS